MKRIITTLLTLVMLLIMSSCGGAAVEDSVMLPIEGHFSAIDGIIVETDKKSVDNDAIPNARAFNYKDGKFYELKRHETEITLPGEVVGNDAELSIPLQYFICNKRVYAYPNIERTMLGERIEIYSIPNNEKFVLVEAGIGSKPVCVDVKSGKITQFCDKEKLLYADMVCVSEDGKYAALNGTKENEHVRTAYIMELSSFELREVPLPNYYSQVPYDLKDSRAVCFADDRLYVNYTVNKLDVYRGIKDGTFFYNVKKGISEDLAAPLDYTNSEYPHIKIKFEQETGTLKIKNMKSITDYSFSVYPSNALWCNPNITGQYFIGACYDMPVAGYDENGQPYYENAPENIKHIVVDVKNQKQIDLTKADSKFNYTEYNGVPCRVAWISETELLVMGYEGTKDYILTVINVADVEE